MLSKIKTHFQWFKYTFFQNFLYLELVRKFIIFRGKRERIFLSFSFRLIIRPASFHTFEIPRISFGLEEFSRGRTDERRVRVKLYFHSCVTPLTKGRGNALRAIVIRNEAMSCNVWMESWKEQDARGECKSIELPAIRRAHARPLISWFSFHVEITD